MKLVFLFAIAGIFFVASCADVSKPPAIVENTPPAATKTVDPGHKDDGHDAPRISLADAKKDYDAGDAVIIDVRDAAAYKQEHIKGSLNITLANLAASTDKIPKGKKVIAYCS